MAPPLSFLGDKVWLFSLLFFGAFFFFFLLFFLVLVLVLTYIYGRECVIVNVGAGVKIY